MDVVPIAAQAVIDMAGDSETQLPKGEKMANEKTKKARRDNRANQKNPNNDKFWAVRN